MTIARVMVYVDPGQRAEEQVRVARDAATKFSASIIGVSALAVMPPVVAEGVVIQAATAEDVKRMKATLAGKEDWFRNVVGLPKEKAEWRWDIEYPTEFLANEARAADLIVIKSEYESAGPYRYVDPGEAILRMRRPTIVVPDHVSELKADRIVVGWKDTREARIAACRTRRGKIARLVDRRERRAYDVEMEAIDVDGCAAVRACPPFIFCLPKVQLVSG
jgi:hypothetical protein